MPLPAGYIPRFEGLAEALDTPASVSVRINRAKGGVLPDGADIVPWCGEGYYLDARPSFTLDPAMHQGLYYVQDASSMVFTALVRHLTQGGTPVSLLDACAAPGGKTTAAMAALPPGSMVVANEYVYLRAEALKENLVKWGYPNMAVTRGDTSRLGELGPLFDIVMADVPCSGEGMFRKEPEAVERWSPALVRECVERQRDIIASIWPSLKPGGVLVYSTCTFNREENLGMVEWIASTYGAEPMHMPLDPAWGVVEDGPVAHFLPGRVRGEGLAVALLRKPGDGAFEGVPGSTASRRKGKQPTEPVPTGVKAWMRDAGNMMEIITGSARVAAVPCNAVMQAVARRCDVIAAGVEIAAIKGRDLVPSHHLAMSTSLNRDAFAAAEVDRDTALAYLRHQSVTLGGATPKGIVLLTHGGAPLGFAKNLGNRANNLYPPSWKIRI